MSFLDDFDYVDHDRPAEMITLSFRSVKHETTKAWLIEFEMTQDLVSIEHWMPKSQCTIDRAAKEIEVPEWLAIENEIEGYAV